RDNPAFQLTSANASDIVSICRKLDGLPLALELAAAKVKMWPPRSLLARLRTADLGDGPEDAEKRQQSLDSAIKWSYDPLPSDQQALLQRLAVFAGGFTIDTAAAVCFLSRDDEKPLQQLLRGLVQSSLVRPPEQTNGAPRFRILEPIRDFAL